MTSSKNVAHESAKLHVTGEAIYIDKNNIEKAPVINHTDLELIMLEEKVLRKPPFVGKDGKVKAGYY